MDEKYLEAASYYGFICKGCEDNCCRTHFYHHTFVEYLYLFEGFKTLSDEEQLKINGNIDKPEICPLNFNGLCRLYDFRPMICRLHGIPHELHKPGFNTMKSVGCDCFYKNCGGKKYLQFDRTPFYFKVAEIEKELKQQSKINDKFKLTIAEMIKTF